MGALNPAASCPKERVPVFVKADLCSAIAQLPYPSGKEVALKYERHQRKNSFISTRKKVNSNGKNKMHCKKQGQISIWGSNTIFKKGIGYEIKLYLILVLLTLNCDPVTLFVGCFLSSYNSTLVGIRHKLPIGKDQHQGQ